MKRWVAALVAVLFLSTATLHVFAHHGAADDGCAVCHVQQTAVPGAAAPRVVVAVRTKESFEPAPSVPSVGAPRDDGAPARAPPVIAA